MQFTLALVALAATAVSAQGVSSVITPTASAPAGCSTSYSGNFEITVVLPSSSKKRDIVERSTTCASDGTLVASLTAGVLTDAKGRIGAIVANHQFQFDGPPAQEGSIYTGGWSVCSNGSLALGGTSVFYQCLSGDFYNLYNTAAGASCELVIIDIIPCTTSSSTTASAVSQASDGQATAASAVSQTSDGQPQAESATVLATQISDGQIQASSAVPKPVSQYTDGQIQVTASPIVVSAVATPVAQITDGQIQASSATAVAVSQISDGQIQATAAATLATSTTLSPVSQISDGQIQATAASNATKTTTTAATYTGAASMMTLGSQVAAGAAALFAFAML